MTFHSLWIAKPPLDFPGIEISEFLDRLKLSFAFHHFDAEGARADALKRLELLASLNPPEEIVASYRDTKPVRIKLADEEGAPFMLDFTVWPDPSGILNRIDVCFATAEQEDACYPMLTRIADFLGWELEEDTEAS